MKNPIQSFFSLGDKVTKGDPVRKADWDYYMLWIMFIAFASIWIDNWWLFFSGKGSWYNFGWGFVMVAILWFQYFGLKGSYEMRKMIHAQFDSKNPQPKEESEEEMMKGFNKKDMKGGDAKNK